MPEVQAYANDLTFQACKEDMKYLKEHLDTLHFETAAMEQERYEGEWQTTTWQTQRAKLDPAMMSIIDELRPTTWEIDPQIADVLQYAGITPG